MLLTGTVLGVLQAANTWQACECHDTEAQQHLGLGERNGNLFVFF